jgi:hypothetical protein
MWSRNASHCATDAPVPSPASSPAHPPVVAKRNDNDAMNINPLIGFVLGLFLDRANGMGDLQKASLSNDEATSSRHASAVKTGSYGRSPNSGDGVPLSSWAEPALSCARTRTHRYARRMP